MIVGIEQLKVVEEFAKLQRRVYPDACDYGYVWDNLEEVQRLKAAVVGLMEIYESKSDSRGGPNTEHSKSVELFIPYEQDGEEYVGAKLWIVTFWDHFRSVTFTKIEINPYRQKESGFKK